MRRTSVLIGAAILAVSVLAQSYGHRKMSADLYIKSRHYDASVLHSDLRRISKASESVTVYLSVDSVCNVKKMDDYGVNVINSMGNIIVAKVPVSQLQSLAADTHVVKMESAVEKELYNDNTRSVTCVDNIQDEVVSPLTEAFDGSGVLVGVVDGGFNFRHPSFLNADGTLAIERFETPYGDMISSCEGADKIYALGHSNGSGLHGTHVLGTIAGRGVSGRHRGMAPGASIVLSDDMQNDAEAFLRMYQYAKEREMPMVVNFSAGTHIPYGLESDVALQQHIIDSISSQPGFIIVAAAGNEGMKNMYRKKADGVVQQDTLTASGNRLAFGLRTKGKTDVQLVVDAGNSMADTLSISTDSVFDNIYYENLKNTGVTFAAFRQDSIYKSLTFIVLKSDNTTNKPLPRFIVRTSGDAAEMNTYTGTVFTSRGMLAHHEGTVGFPALYKNVIAVGATERREKLTNYKGEEINYGGYEDYMNDVAPWSSCGAELEDIVKPDVVAPGTNIVSTLDYRERNKETQEGKSLVVELNKNADLPYGWSCMTGTSMAAPAVTGIIALWLEADPTLTAERIREVFRNTSTPINPNVSYPNTVYGTGEINAYKGLLDVLGVTSGISEISGNPLPPSRMHVTNGNICIQLGEPANVTVYTTDGQVVSSSRHEAGDAKIGIGGRHGIFVVQVTTDNKTTSGSQVVRI